MKYLRPLKFSAPLLILTAFVLGACEIEAQSIEQQVRNQNIWQFGGNPYSPYSSENPYSRMNNPFNPNGRVSPDSEWNNPYSPNSPKNEFGTGYRVYPQTMQ